MKKASLYIMALLYVVAGINHFIHPVIYMGIMPEWLPCHLPLVYISGLCELLFGLLLLLPDTRRWAAIGIILTLIAIFPANIQMTINYARENNKMLWLSLARLPLQLALIYWAYCFTKRGYLRTGLLKRERDLKLLD